jgi:hypothetical protein
MQARRTVVMTATASGTARASGRTRMLGIGSGATATAEFLSAKGSPCTATRMLASREATGGTVETVAGTTVPGTPALDADLETGERPHGGASRNAPAPTDLWSAVA